MRTSLARIIALTMIVFLFVGPLLLPNKSEADTTKRYVYDFAELLTESETIELEKLSIELSQERETDFIILTTMDTKGKDVVGYMQDFYDEMGLGFDQTHGNTAILTIDMQNREVYVAGFYKAERYLDDERLDAIRGKITPSLSAGEYFSASKQFMEVAHTYMGYEPGVNPDNILFKSSFQLVIALFVGGLVVSIMLYRSSGRVTVNDRTYMDNSTSRVIDQDDKYIRTTVTKVKKPTPNNSVGGGGGGGMTGGGHSHSGSRGGF